MKETPTQPTIVEVTAPWCAECRAMEPKIEAVSSRYPEVDFRVVDASTDPGTVSALGVKATPTLIAYAGGREVFRSTGRRTGAELESMFEAAVGDDARAPDVGNTDRVLRVGAGAALVLLGLLSGPIWPLVGVGTIIGLFGFLPIMSGDR